MRKKFLITLGLSVIATIVSIFFSFGEKACVGGNDYSCAINIVAGWPLQWIQSYPESIMFPSLAFDLLFYFLIFSLISFVYSKITKKKTKN